MFPSENGSDLSLDPQSWKGSKLAAISRVRGARLKIFFFAVTLFAYLERERERERVETHIRTA